jgi:hypothetical protein
MGFYPVAVYYNKTQHTNNTHHTNNTPHSNKHSTQNYTNTHCPIVPRSIMVELYISSSIRLHGLLLN